MRACFTGHPPHKDFFNPAKSPNVHVVGAGVSPHLPLSSCRPSGHRSENGRGLHGGGLDPALALASLIHGPLLLPSSVILFQTKS